jgi:hypothetical protein
MTHTQSMLLSLSLVCDQVPGMASSFTRSQQRDEPAPSSNKGRWKYAVGNSDVSLRSYIHAVHGYKSTYKTAMLALIVSHAAMFTFTDPVTGAIKFSS